MRSLPPKLLAEVVGRQEGVAKDRGEESDVGDVFELLVANGHTLDALLGYTTDQINLFATRVMRRKRRELYESGVAVSLGVASVLGASGKPLEVLLHGSQSGERGRDVIAPDTRERAHKQLASAARAQGGALSDGG